jgi:glycosyltransferase involved in cell wall biosynthesis
MEITVIIPTHNRRDTLARALDSVLAQTMQPTEVIVVDDGSSDDTRRLVAGYPRVRYLYQENAGVSSARNLGIEAARGEWLAFLDSDDEWQPDKLRHQQALLVNNPSLKICHTEEIWIRNGRRVNAMKKHAKSGGYIFDRCLPLCVISPSSVIIHKSVFQTVGTFDPDLPACEDYDLWLRICAHYPVGFVESPQIIKYGGHEDQLSQRFWGMDRFRITALEKIIGSGTLCGDNLHQAVRTLIGKAAILENGASKRGRIEEAARYQALQQRYRELSDERLPAV